MIQVSLHQSNEDEAKDISNFNLYDASHNAYEIYKK